MAIVLDQSNTTRNNSWALRYNTSQHHLAIPFVPGVSGKRAMVMLNLYRQGTVSGTVYVQIQGDSNGLPNNTSIAQSAALDASQILTSGTDYIFYFQDPVYLVAGTRYHYVLLGTYTVSTSNFIALSNQYSAGGDYRPYASELCNSSNVWSNAQTARGYFYDYYEKQSNLTASVLVVAGGGGSGSSTASYGGGGGGGAGGYLYYHSLTLYPKAYSITVGGGGNGATAGAGGVGSNGSNSTFGSITAVGGGGGGSGGSAGSTVGADGGSGGGAGYKGYALSTPGNAQYYQGNNGGNNGATSGAGGGGGGGSYGAGQAPTNSPTHNGGLGGFGTTNSITGTATVYAAGGRGGDGGNTAGSNGTANTGNGGNSPYANATPTGNGGSGIVVIRYKTADFGTCTGGTITTDGNYTIHTFTGNGTFTVVAPTAKKTIGKTTVNVKKDAATVNASLKKIYPVFYNNYDYFPKSIPNLKCWYDSSKITGLSDGNMVAQWNDSSGNGNHITQGTDAKKPLYKTNIINGLPAVRFDGSNDLLSVASLTLPTFMSIFVVSDTITSGKGFFIEHGPNVNTNDGFFFYGEGGSTYAVRRSGGVHSVQNSGWFGTNWAIGDAIYNGSFSNRKNAGLDISNATGSGTARSNSDLTDTLYVGERTGDVVPMSGDFAEIIIYSSVVSEIDRRNIENYLLNKYGL